MSMIGAGQASLARKSLTVPNLVTFGITASAPMTVLAGGVVTTYASTGVVGVPLAFVLLTVVLGFFAVGFTVLAVRVPHPAAFYALLARGLNREWGVAGAAVALVAYNAIQISLYGLFGATMSSLFGGSWWVWSLAVLFLIGSFGVLQVAVSTRVLGTVLVAEFVIIALLDVAAFAAPAEGFSFAPLAPSNLLVDGLGGVLALTVAAFVGFETVASYSEEATTSRGPRRAVFLSLGMMGGVYAVSSWAMAIAVGPDNVAAVAGDPASGFPFAILSGRFGALAANAGIALLVTSIVAAMLSFHSAVARTVFGLARERVVPQVLAFTGNPRGMSAPAPIGGSVLQSAVALTVLVVFGALGADPLAVMFTWLSTLAAIGVLVLMVLTCLAVIGYFAAHGDDPASTWESMWAPLTGLVLLLGVLGITVVQLDALLGVVAGSLAPWALPGIIAAAALAGAAWAVRLRSARPEIYQAIGRGQPKRLAVIDRSLRHVVI